MLIYAAEICKNGDIFSTEHENFEDAVKSLTKEWDHMSNHDKSKCDLAQVTLYGIKDDEYKIIDVVYDIFDEMRCVYNEN